MPKMVDIMLNFDLKVIMPQKTVKKHYKKTEFKNRREKKYFNMEVTKFF